MWYIISSSNNVIGKMVLSTFPYPMTVTMVQLTSITLYSGPFFNLWGIRKYSDISWNYYLKLIIPLALGKFFASVTSHISIWKVPVSYAHTGKHQTNKNIVKSRDNFIEIKRMSHHNKAIPFNSLMIVKNHKNWGKFMGVRVRAGNDSIIKIKDEDRYSASKRLPNINR